MIRVSFKDKELSIAVYRGGSKRVAKFLSESNDTFHIKSKKNFATLQ